MNVKTMMLTATLTLVSGGCLAQPKVIAHRGFWNTEGSAQNSTSSLAKADSIGCYGTEFDVWLSKDKVLVVNHDPIFKGHIVQKSSAAKLTALKLANGESLPTLKAYFEKARQHPGIELVLELKPHSTPERETQAAGQIVQMAKDFGLENRIQYISFSLHATKELVRLSPSGTPVYYLNGDLPPQELKKIGCAGMDYNLRTIRKNPGWIKEAHGEGLKINVWTVNKEKDMKWLIGQGVDFITTDKPLLLQELIKKNKDGK